jgi:excisionase family DNA binding protein
MQQEIIQKIELSDESIAKLAAVISQSYNFNPAAKKYMTVNEAAEYLRIGGRQIRALIKENKIPFYKLDGKILLKPVELDNVVEKNKRESLNELIQRATNRGR